jgi:hypothetical protein
MAGHMHEHGDARAAEHTPGKDSGSAGCGGELSDCANLDNINQNDRVKTFSPDFKLVGLAPPPHRCSQLDAHGPPLPSGTPDSAKLAGAFPPLNILYCVYLD